MRHTEPLIKFNKFEDFWVSISRFMNSVEVVMYKDSSHEKLVGRVDNE